MLINPNYKKPEYKIWSNLIQRCTNPKNTNYKHYGARGITVCDRWRLSFNAFFEDVGPRPELTATLERKDNNKGYFKGNVVWADRKCQNRNTRRNSLITIEGKTQSIAAWAEEVGVEYGTFMGRVLRGIIGTDLKKPTSFKHQNSKAKNQILS